MRPRPSLPGVADVLAGEHGDRQRGQRHVPPGNQWEQGADHEDPQQGQATGPSAIAPARGGGRRQEQVGDALTAADQQRLPLADLGSRHRRGAPEKWKETESPGIEPGGQHTGNQDRDDGPHRRARRHPGVSCLEPTPPDLDDGPDTQHAQPGEKPRVEVRPEREERRSGVQPSRIAAIQCPEDQEDDEEESVRDHMGTHGEEEGHEEVDDGQHDDPRPLRGKALTAEQSVDDIRAAAGRRRP